MAPSPSSTSSSGAPPSAADSLDAAAANADTSVTPDNVGSPVTACPPAPAAAPVKPAPADPVPLPPGPKTFIEILVTDENDQPVANQRYKLKLTDSSIQEGRLDASGRIFLSSISAGTCDLMFPEMIDFGTPTEEIKRSWNWKPAKGDDPKVTKPLDSGNIRLSPAGAEDEDQSETDSDSQGSRDDSPKEEADD